MLLLLYLIILISISLSDNNEMNYNNINIDQLDKKGKALACSLLASYLLKRKKKEKEIKELLNEILATKYPLLMKNS
jgi:hypothetical protein